MLKFFLYLFYSFLLYNKILNKRNNNNLILLYYRLIFFFYSLSTSVRMFNNNEKNNSKVFNLERERERVNLLFRLNDLAFRKKKDTKEV